MYYLLNLVQTKKAFSFFRGFCRHESNIICDVLAHATIHVYLLSYCVYKNYVCNNNGELLEQNGGWTAVVNILNSEHLWVKQGSQLWQHILEPGKQRGVIQGPLWCVLEINNDKRMVKKKLWKKFCTK